MIGETDLRVLSALDSRKSRQALAEELEYREDTISEALSTLEQLDLVRRKRSGTGTIVEPSDARCIEAFQSLTKSNPHVDFPDLLTPSLLHVLYYLTSDDPWTATELTERTGYARATIYRNLRTLTNRAMAIKDRSKYRLTEEFSTLHTFAYELRHHSHRVRIKRDVGSGTLVWESHDEFLVRIDSAVDNPAYHRTGLDAFAAYGLQFFTTSEYYYLYSDARETLDPADLVCHLLLIENDSRHRKYALLLVAKTGVTRAQLEEAASYYGVEEIVQQLAEFLHTAGDTTSEQTPSWEAFETLAAEYGVEL